MEGEEGRDGPARRVGWQRAVAAGLLYGLYGPLVFHDGFLLRDGPVAHLSTLLLVWPLLARGAARRARAAFGSRAPRRRGRFSSSRPSRRSLASLCVSSLYSPSKKSPGGAQRRSLFLLGFSVSLFRLGVLAARNISAGVPPLTFDTRQAIGLAWGNARGPTRSTSSPAAMGEILAEADGLDAAHGASRARELPRGASRASRSSS